jgi:hypothetical protein
MVLLIRHYASKLQYYDVLDASIVCARADMQQQHSAAKLLPITATEHKGQHKVDKKNILKVFESW